MSQQKLLEKLIDEVSKNLSLSINSIVKLGQAHPVLALKILAVPVVCISISLPMFACWLMLKSLLSCPPQEYNQFDREPSHSHLEKLFDSPSSTPSDRSSDRKHKIFLNEPSAMLPLSNELKSRNPFISSRSGEFSKINVIPETDIFALDNNFIPSNPTKNDNQIDLDMLSAVLDDELLNELNSFETLIVPNGSLFSNLDANNFLLSSIQPGVKSVPDPSSIIALLAIAGVGLKALKKKRN